MKNTLYDINAIRNKQGKPPVLRSLIERVLFAEGPSREDNGIAGATDIKAACYADMEQMLMGGYSGSIQFDKAYAVDVLLWHDTRHGRHIRAFMNATKGAPMNRRQLWNHLQKVLENAGMMFKGGVMIGPRIEYQGDDSAVETGDVA